MHPSYSRLVKDFFTIVERVKKLQDVLSSMGTGLALPENLTRHPFLGHT